jgi:restriction system protein
MAKNSKGPQFLRYCAPVVETLKEMGYSGNGNEVVDRVIERMKISEAEQAETTTNGQSRVRNQINWARFYLAKAGLVDAPRRGVWSLTEAGRTAKLDPDTIHALFKQTQAKFSKSQPSATPASEGDAGADADPSGADDDSYEAELLGILRGLPPGGFERICQRVLRESGFEKVEVTGQSGDGGIDGHGVLAVNPLVTFKVLFQCKRYKDGRQVTVSQVRDFRGAMAGRADKGIIITTGTFTTDAKKEATRDGVPPIELVDQDKLVTMFERAKLGLRPKETFEVDAAFFEEFRK